MSGQQDTDRSCDGAGDGVSTYDNAVLSRVFNPHLPYAEIKDPEPEPEEELTIEVVRAKELELAGVKAAEEKDYGKAIDLLTQSINTAPARASGYNNRAQARRLAGDNTGAMDDLDCAIELSQGRGRAACQAYTQRAILRRVAGSEEDSLEDFKAAADLGGEFARSMLVKLNPFAALCNQMLAQVFTKLRDGQEVE